MGTKQNIYLKFYFSFSSGQNNVKGEMRSSCQAKRKIGFLKTHKCASSTIQNILMRFAIKNDLNVVLPKEYNILGKEFVDHFDRKIIKNTLWERAALKYDIFLCHTRWNHTSISEVLNDHNNVFYFSILRYLLESCRHQNIYILQYLLHFTHPPRRVSKSGAYCC